MEILSFRGAKESHNPWNTLSPSQLHLNKCVRTISFSCSPSARAKPSRSTHSVQLLLQPKRVSFLGHKSTHRHHREPLSGARASAEAPFVPSKRRPDPAQSPVTADGSAAPSPSSLDPPIRTDPRSGVESPESSITSSSGTADDVSSEVPASMRPTSTDQKAASMQTQDPASADQSSDMPAGASNPKGSTQPSLPRSKQALSEVVTPALATAVESPLLSGPVNSSQRRWSLLTSAAMQAQRSLLPPIAERPPSLRERIQNGKPVLHFAFGSNLSLAKLTSRVPGGIQPLAFQPAMVRGHRLAFNLAGFGLVEPTMASIEPMDIDERDSGAGEGGRNPRMAVDGAYKGVLAEGAYRGVRRDPEIHGLLVTLRPEEYDLLYVSEGGAAGPFRAYLEHEVTAVTYTGEEFQAVAFRANPSSRGTLPRSEEKMPSRRYLSLIIQGAKERGLDPAYVGSLERRLARIRDPLDIFG